MIKIKGKKDIIGFPPSWPEPLIIYLKIPFSIYLFGVNTSPFKAKTVVFG